MLHLRYSTRWRDLSDSVIQSVCENADRGVEGQILIVPEQVSFDAEWRLCEAGGDRISRFAEVLSFTRLAGRVFSVAGGAARQTLDQSGRLIAMAGALEQVRSRLKIYGRHVAKPEFLLQLLSLYDEFRSYGVNASAIEGVWGSLSGTLAEKMEELSLIMESYDALCAGAMQDPATRLDRLCEALETSDYPGGRRMFVDGFSDFTVQELRVLELLAQGGAELTVALCLDDPIRGGSLFSVPRDTAQRLRRMAERWELGWEERRIPSGGPDTALTYLQRSLFAPGGGAWEGAAASLCFSQGENPWEEGLAVVGEIQTLTAGGASYRDIAVAYPDEAVYRPVLENLFARYRIPVYFSGNETVLKEPAVRCVLSALEAASMGMEADAVMDYLRSGFAPVDRDMADALENYAFVWGLRGTLWEREFRLPPEGYRNQPDPASLAARLEALNRGRTAALEPLIRLKNGLIRAKTTGDQVFALHRFLEEIGLRPALEALAAGETDHKRAQEYAQLYELLLSVLEQIYGVLGRTVRTAEEFFRFFRAAVSQQTVGTIPAAVRCVHGGEYAAIRSRRPRHLLVLGADDGKFPGGGATGSLLTDRERRELIRAELPVAPDAAGQLERELLRLYLLLSAPSETLFLSCTRERESYLYTRAVELFPLARRQAAAVRPVTETQAAALLAALPAGLDSRADPDLRDRAAALRRRSGWTFDPLSPATVAALYGQTVRLSATSIDKYASCKLAFFLDHGIRAAELRPAGVDAPIFGDFVHFVLQRTVEEVMAAGGFHTVPLEQVRALSGTFTEEFVRERLGGLADQPQRVISLFERSRGELETIVDQLWAELHVSDFQPERCEMEFNEILPASGGHACRIHGFVDRVDLFRPGRGPAYLRVVDYKTGQKDFDLTDILVGRGLQMLIYLFALEDRGAELFHTRVLPAGVLYFPARVFVKAEKDKPSPAEAEQLRQDQFLRKGMLLMDEQVLAAMEERVEEPRFLPYTVSSAGKYKGNLATAEQFRQLRDHVRRTVGEMTDQILSGVVAPNPYQRDPTHSACTYCPHKLVCHVQSGAVPIRKLSATKWEEFLEKLEETEARSHGQI